MVFDKENIKMVEFEEYVTRKISIEKVAIYNERNISEAEVDEIIMAGMTGFNSENVLFMDKDKFLRIFMKWGWQYESNVFWKSQR